MSFQWPEDDCKTGAEVVARAKRARANLRAAQPHPTETKPASETIVREVRPYEPPPRSRGFLTRFVPPRRAGNPATDVALDPPPPETEPVTILNVRTVIEKAVSLFGFSWVEMRSSRRGWPLVRYRQIAMYVAWKKTPASLPVIGQAFGGRDHTTVLHAGRTIEKFVATDPEIKAAVDALLHELGCPPDITRTRMYFLRDRPPMRGSYWSPKELDILKRLYIEQQLSAEETAKHLPGRTLDAIMSRAARIVPGEMP